MTSSHITSYSKSEIDRAGRILRESKPGSKRYQAALAMVNDWRTSHAYPMNTFNATLRLKVKRYKDALVAQRLKRLPTIVNKLSRQPGMNLSRMQDIGGVRAVVNSIRQVEELQRQYLDQKRFTHDIIKVDDYIVSPKSDGYRGVHLVFKYNNTLARNGLAEKFKGLSIEVQLRTKLQHTWATAVETVGTFRGESYKTDEGAADWLEFFSYVSSAFAMVEKQPVVEAHKNMNPIEIVRAVEQLENKLGVLNQIKGLAIAADAIHSRNMGGFYNLITLNKSEQSVMILSFSKDEVSAANAEYVRRESLNDPTQDHVLVSAGDLRKLKLAYPNYFLDVSDFVQKVNIIIQESRDI